MTQFFQWVESLGFSVWVRESGSIWSYPVILFLHTVGLGFLVGPSVAIGLRILGVAPQLPVAPMERLYPIMWLGFWINATSGLMLLMADATTKMINWDFYVKLAFIGIAVRMLFLIRKAVFGPSPGMNRGIRREKTLALILLTCWAGAITAGRLMAYLGPVSGAPNLNNKF
jgi:hypothetical protein